MLILNKYKIVFSDESVEKYYVANKCGENEFIKKIKNYNEEVKIVNWTKETYICCDSCGIYHYQNEIKLIKENISTNAYCGSCYREEMYFIHEALEEKSKKGGE